MHLWNSYNNLFSLSPSGGIDSNNISSNLDEPEEAKTSTDTSIWSNSGAGSLSENGDSHDDGAQEDKENSGQEVNTDRYTCHDIGPVESVGKTISVTSNTCKCKM